MGAQSVADKEPVDVVRETGERVRRVALEILDELPDAGIGDGYPPGLDRTGPDAEREIAGPDGGVGYSDSGAHDGDGRRLVPAL